VFPVRYELNLYVMYKKVDRLCDIMVRVPSHRSRGPGSIPSATRFSDKFRVRNGVHSASLSTTEELLEKKSSDSCLESREYGRRNPSRWPRGTSYP
jgi:hypothetical protein